MGNVIHQFGCRCTACERIREIDVQRTDDAAGNPRKSVSPSNKTGRGGRPKKK